MINFFQMGSSIYQILITLTFSLIITMVATLNMLDKKRLSLFMPFFICGIGLCLSTGFIFYDFFGIAIDVFYVFNFVSVVWMFFIIWRVGK